MGKKHDPQRSEEDTDLCGDESKLAFLIQTFIPFLLAGCGMVSAGILLDRAKNWRFLLEVPEALILVPALLGLKGNLEMTLASRISTIASYLIRMLDTKDQQIAALTSNVSLVQVQAIVVSLLASFIATCTSLAEGNEFALHRAVTLMLTAVVTASAASLVLSVIMVVLAIVAKKWRINPDNISTPIAATLGDVTTLAVMVSFGSIFTQYSKNLFFYEFAALSAMLLTLPFWIYCAAKNRFTVVVLKNGWYIVIFAMVISSCGGYVLKLANAYYETLTVFQPLVNGVGGNLVAVQASKISTYLHRHGKLGVIPCNTLMSYVNPLRTFALLEEESVNALFLSMMSIPGHTIFLTMIFLLEEGEMFDWKFYTSYMFIALLQLVILLYVCQITCRLMWKLRVDPDNNVIPFLTSLGDLLGTSLLTLMYFFLTRVASASLPVIKKAVLE